MSTAKLAIILYSTSGTNHEMAHIAADAAREAGAEVRLLRVAETAPKAVVEGQEAWKAQADRMSDIPVVSHDDLLWADAQIFPRRPAMAPPRRNCAPSSTRSVGSGRKANSSTRSPAP